MSPSASQTTRFINKLIAQKKKLGGAAERRHIEAIGDALAPGLIADSIFSGHLAAENFEMSEIEIERAMYMREMPSLK